MPLCPVRSFVAPIVGPSCGKWTPDKIACSRHGQPDDLPFEPYDVGTPPHNAALRRCLRVRVRDSHSHVDKAYLLHLNSNTKHRETLATLQGCSDAQQDIQKTTLRYHRLTRHGWPTELKRRPSEYKDRVRPRDRKTGPSSC